MHFFRRDGAPPLDHVSNHRQLLHPVHGLPAEYDDWHSGLEDLPRKSHSVTCDRSDSFGDDTAQIML